MNIISAFFNKIWSNLHQEIIPIIEMPTTYLIIGIILVSFLLDCVNKILSKDSIHTEGK